jgi:hypothetical protein
MKFSPILPFEEAVKNKKLSFRDKLVYCYCYFMHSKENNNEFSNIAILKDILLNEIANKDLYLKIQNFIKNHDLPISLKERLQFVLGNFDSKFENDLSYIKNNDLKSKIFLNEKDLIPFASKKEIGGMRDGYIGCNTQNLKLFLVKGVSMSVKFQDECFINRVLKIIIREYCPFETYLVKRRMMSVSLVGNSFNLRKFNRKKDFEMHDIEKYRKLNYQFFKNIFENKKVYGLITNLIGSIILLNRDLHNGNTMVANYYDECKEILFFNIDPTHWSMKNKYNIDTNEFAEKIRSLFTDFAHSKFTNMILFRRQLVRFLTLSLKTKYDYFLGRILTGITYLDPRFKDHDEDEAHQTLKTVAMNQFMEFLPHIVNNLSDEEIMKELNVFLDVDFNEIEKLYDEFYNKNGEICRLSIENKDDQEFGVQYDFIENLKYNLSKLQEKIRSLS